MYRPERLRAAMLRTYRDPSPQGKGKRIARTVLEADSGIPGWRLTHLLRATAPMDPSLGELERLCRLAGIGVETVFDGEVG